MAERRPRTDTRGILHPAAGLARFRMRRRAVAEPLAPYAQHYWLIDWSLREPYEQHVVSHPTVNLVFQTLGPPVVSGVSRGLFSVKLEGTGRVVGAQFQPGGFRPFLGGPVSALTDRQVPAREVFGPEADRTAEAVLAAAGDDEITALMDAFLTARLREPDPVAAEVAEMVAAVAADATLTRVDLAAARLAVPVRRLQRLFAEYVGVSPKWVIRRYRIMEAAERAAAGTGVNWAELAAELGYADQAHLVRDFTAAVGVSPAQYARQDAALRTRPR